ncbi:MAG: hypothetical protein ACK5Q5_20205, partial [Planctomycetaceae bacterium]
MTNGVERLRFPLPLRRYESFMLLDEHASYPMTFVLELRLTGRLDQEAFLSAYRRTLEVHPLLTARVERSRWSRSRWVASDTLPELHWGSHDQPSSVPAPLDITREPGVKVWVEDHPHQPRVLLQFHHVATDGVGAIQFIGDLLARYGLSTTRDGQPAPLPAAVDINRLYDRELLWPDRRFQSRLLSSTVRRLRDLSRKLPRPVVDLAATDGPRLETSDGPPPFPTYATRIIEGIPSANLQRASRGLFSLNDLATLSMFRTVRDWNQRQSPSESSGNLRLSLPFSLRLPMHDDSPAANQLSL